MTHPPQSVQYALEPDLSIDEFVSVLRRSGLASRRPVEERARVSDMLKHADIIVTARDPGGQLIGVSRAITDFSYCTYLSDLAVDEVCQKQGIGRQLIAETHLAAGVGTRLILLSAPAARSYYPHIGMQRHDCCWTIPPRGAGDQP